MLISTVVAQTATSVDQENQNDEKIALTDIIGDWYAIDSSGSKIRMVNVNNLFVDLEGIRHGVGNYSFKICGDSISVNGLAINWPPYDCRLRLLEDHFLEIEFYQFFYTTSTKVIYKR